MLSLLKSIWLCLRMIFLFGLSELSFTAWKRLTIKYLSNISREVYQLLFCQKNSVRANNSLLPWVCIAVYVHLLSPHAHMESFLGSLMCTGWHVPPPEGMLHTVWRYSVHWRCSYSLHMQINSRSICVCVSVWDKYFSLIFLDLFGLHYTRIREMRQGEICFCPTEVRLNLV